MRIILLLVIGVGIAVLAAAVTLKVMHGRDIELVAARFEAVLRHGDDARFDPESVAHLPPPARRWLEFALGDADRLPASVELAFGGRMRLSPDTPWVECKSTQALTRDSYVWRISVDTADVALEGAELYAEGAGEIRFWMSGFIPSSQDDPDLTRSLRGRLAFDRIFLPSTLLPGDDVEWEPVDDRRAVAVVRIDGGEERVQVTVADDGTLEHVTLRRWGHRTEDGVFTDIPFGATILAHESHAGLRIPSRLRIAWWHDTERQEPFLEPELENATFR